MPAPVSFAWLDQSKHIWLCNEETIFIYNTDTGEVTHIKNDISEEINDIEQIDDTHYFIGTEMLQVIFKRKFGNVFIDRGIFLL